MKIQLDTGAMNALFPEGSEARVKLQSAVIANFTKKMYDNWINGEVKEEVHKTIREHGTSTDIGKLIRAELDKEFDTGGSWWNKIYSLKEGSEIKKAVTKYASDAAFTLKHQVSEEQKGVIKTSMEQAKARLLQDIELAVKKVEADMERRVEQRISAKMDELIRLEFAKIMNRQEPIVK